MSVWSVIFEMFKLCFVVGLFVCASVFGAKLPPEVKRCDRKAANYKECLLVAVQDAVILGRNAIPQVGLPAMEPLEIPAITIGTGGGVVAVQQNYKNVRVYGFTNVKIHEVMIDLDAKTIKLKGLFNQIKMVADYDLNGKVLLLPIQGTGPSTFIMDKILGDLAFTFDVVEKKGKKHIKITGNTLKLEPEHVSFDFVNLFNGDKALGDNINKVLNENWKEVFDDVKSGYEEAYGRIFEGLAEALFSRVPLNEIFLNEEF